MAKKSLNCHFIYNAKILANLSYNNEVLSKLRLSERDLAFWNLLIAAFFKLRIISGVVTLINWLELKFQALKV